MPDYSEMTLEQLTAADREIRGKIAELQAERDQIDAAYTQKAALTSAMKKLSKLTPAEKAALKGQPIEG